MSNVKKVTIEGDLNTMGVLEAASGLDASNVLIMALVYQHILKDEVEKAMEAAKVIQGFMAQSVVPYFGLSLRFTGKERTASNSVNGVVRYLAFVIEGEEAVSWKYTEHLVSALSKWGNVTKNEVKDIEA